MSKPVYRKRVDSNHKQVIEALRTLPGVTVVDLSGVGNGCPDFVVGFQGVNYMVELKDGAKPKHQKKLTDAEKKWHSEWRGQVAVCESFADVFRLITGQWPYTK